MRVLTIAIASLFFLADCGKKPKCKEPEYTHFIPEVGVFNFQFGSSWLYKSNLSLQTREMKIDTNTAIKMISSNTEPSTSNNSECSDVSIKGDYRDVFFKHNLIGNQTRIFFYSIRTNMICVNPVQSYDEPAVWALPDRFSDTVRVPFPFHVKKVVRVAIHQPLIIQNVTYPKVFEIFYYPSYLGFRKIWWAPNIGFVKMESVDENEIIEAWELVESHPIL